MMQYVDGLIVC